jgi:thiamine biosynthesis lipoprotein
MPPAAEPAIATFLGRSMGSSLRLLVAGTEPGPDQARDRTLARLWLAVRAEFAATDLALSKYRQGSALTRLNALVGSEVASVPAPHRLSIALDLGAAAREATDGRFDLAVLAALDGLGEAATATPPDAIDVEVVAAIGAEPVDGTVVVPRAPLDLGGIGKGLALRWAAERITPVLPAGAGALIDAGGDLVIVGAAPDGGWQVGVEDPMVAGEHVAVVALASCAIATSSVRIRHWIDGAGRAQHHLIDPRTSMPARTDLVAVTVADPDPAWAEIWTKALFLAGRAGIGPEARERDLAAWWVDAAGRVGLTPAAREMSAWVDEARIG